MKPIVSIVVPMRNAEAYIRRTLASILEEKDITLELLVVDDQSTDNSAEIVMSSNDDRVRMIRGPGEGISAAMNVGLAVAQGEFIMRCDADDLFTPGRIYRQVSWLRENPSYGAICGGFTILDSRGRHLAVLTTGESETEITEELRNGITRTSLCTFAIRRSVVEKVGDFRPYFVTAEDIDYQLRLSGDTQVKYLPESFYLYRLHDHSTTHTQNKDIRVFYEETARLFQQQRLIRGRDDLDKNHPPPIPASKFGLPGKANEQIAGILMGQAWLEHERGRKMRAIKVGLCALLKKPLSLNQWKSVMALFLK